MSAGWGVSVRQSRLTKHWIAKRGNECEGFRRWQDAMDQANVWSERYRQMVREHAELERRR